MRTPAVAVLPKPPRILRAACADCKTRKMPLPPTHFLSDYLWKFNGALPQIFLPMYLDFRYGFVLFRSDDVGDVTPDYGWTLPDYIPPGELTIPSDELRINVDGTTYGKMWDSDVHELSVADVVSIAELVSAAIADVVYNAVFEDPCIVRKYGYDCEPGADSSDAWDMYDADPQSTTFEGTSCNFSCTSTYPTECPGAAYVAKADKLYFKFNTAGTAPGFTSATITFTCDARNNTGLSNPTLRLYSQDYGEEVDADDWGGGALVNAFLLDVGNVWPLEEVDVSFSVDASYVSLVDWSKFKLNLKEVDDNTHPSTATGFVCQNITSVKLTLRY